MSRLPCWIPCLSLAASAGCWWCDPELLRAPVSASSPAALDALKFDGSEEDVEKAAKLRRGTCREQCHVAWATPQELVSFAGVIHFAGEACNADFQGSLPAAFLSGKEVAEDVIQEMQWK